MSASAPASAQAGSGAGKGATMIDAGGAGGAGRGSRCQSSSVTYGISGCSSLAARRAQLDCSARARAARRYVGRHPRRVGGGGGRACLRPVSRQIHRVSR